MYYQPPLPYYPNQSYDQYTQFYPNNPFNQPAVPMGQPQQPHYTDFQTHTQYDPSYQQIPVAQPAIPNSKPPKLEMPLYDNNGRLVNVSVTPYNLNFGDGITRVVYLINKELPVRVPYSVPSSSSASKVLSPTGQSENPEALISDSNGNYVYVPVKQYNVQFPNGTAGTLEVIDDSSQVRVRVPYSDSPSVPSLSTEASLSSEEIRRQRNKDDSLGFFLRFITGPNLGLSFLAFILAGTMASAIFNQVEEETDGLLAGMVGMFYSFYFLGSWIRHLVNCEQPDRDNKRLYILSVLAVASIEVFFGSVMAGLSYCIFWSYLDPLNTALVSLASVSIVAAVVSEVFSRCNLVDEIYQRNGGRTLSSMGEF